MIEIGIWWGTQARPMFCLIAVSGSVYIPTVDLTEQISVGPPSVKEEE
jgi:hypothetical protein